MITPGPSKRHSNAVHRLRVRLVLLGLGSAIGYLSVVLRITARPVFLRWGFPLKELLPAFLLHFLILFVLAMVAAWLTFRSGADDQATLTLIAGFAILFRILLLPTPPVLSSDIFRYIWDARVQASRLNPYLSRPADFDTEESRKDPLFQQQNRPFARTIYPPMAQAIFRVSRALGGESTTAMKGLMLLGDLAALTILIWLLGMLGLPRSRVILYAWHPLVVFEVAGSGHVDALALPFILLAVLAWQRRRNVLAGIALGAATLGKIFPILLVPAFLSRRRWPTLLASGAIILLGYLPFLPTAGLQVLGHLPRFLTDPDEMFNPSLMGLVVLLASHASRDPVLWAAWIGRVALLCTLAWLAWRKTETHQDLLARIWVVVGAMTLLTLTLHPWYLLWLVPFLAIQPRPAWIYLSGAVVVSYSFYIVTPGTQALIGLLEYLPFFFLLFWQWHRRGSPH